MNTDKVRRFFEPIFVDKKVLFLSLFVWIVIGGYTLVNILLIQKIVAIIESGATDGIMNIAAIFASVNILYFVFVYVSRNHRWIMLDNTIVKYLQEKYLKKFDTISNTHLETFGTGKIISILSRGIETWSDILYDGIRVFVQLIMAIIATIVVISQAGHYYHVIALLVILSIIMYTMFALIRKTKKYREGVVEAIVNRDRQLVKMVMSKFEILQNAKMTQEISHLNARYDQVTTGLKGVWNYTTGMALIPDVLVFVVYISFILVLVFVRVPFSIITSFFLVLGFLNSTVDNIVWFGNAFTRQIPGVQKLWDFFDTAPEMRGLQSGKDFEYQNGDIELRNIVFSYGDNPVLEDFSLKISGNQVTAFVGESGGGKTTLIKLISAFIEPHSGEILIDGQKLSEINLMSYYQDIGYLTQEPSVFDGTILENLTYGMREKVTGEKLQEIIKKAKCEFIYDFKNGLKTEIGERGVRLSGGQKQRLAIAKIFLKNPKIISLDEPTSALDSKSEKLIHESFEELFRGRTVVIIAHRLQTVKGADEIFVLEKGKVVENGTHESLIRKKGYYKEMLDLQSGF